MINIHTYIHTDMGGVSENYVKQKLTRNSVQLILVKKLRIQETLNLSTCLDSSTDTKNHMSCVMRQKSPVTCHLTTTLCNFSCYESPRMLGDAVDGGLVIDIVI